MGLVRRRKRTPRVDRQRNSVSAPLTVLDRALLDHLRLRLQITPL